jgi:hypothetical protein
LIAALLFKPWVQGSVVWACACGATSDKARVRKLIVIAAVSTKRFFDMGILLVEFPSFIFSLSTGPVLKLNCARTLQRSQQN